MEAGQNLLRGSNIILDVYTGARKMLAFWDPLFYYIGNSERIDDFTNCLLLIGPLIAWLKSQRKTLEDVGVPVVSLNSEWKSGREDGGTYHVMAQLHILISDNSASNMACVHKVKCRVAFASILAAPPRVQTVSSSVSRVLVFYSARWVSLVHENAFESVSNASSCGEKGLNQVCVCGGGGGLELELMGLRGGSGVE